MPECLSPLPEVCQKCHSLSRPLRSYRGRRGFLYFGDALVFFRAAISDPPRVSIHGGNRIHQTHRRCQAEPCTNAAAQRAEIQREVRGPA
jgi:hypothetical protein